jgi:hypothetical protein
MTSRLSGWYNPGMQKLIPPELQHEIDASQGQPIPLVHPMTRKVYFLVGEDVFARIQALYPDVDVQTAYAAADETFADNWADPRMAEYDNYEAHRP